MKKASSIAPTLIQAYCETHYIVNGSQPMTLRVGKVSPGLAELHKASFVDCSVFITACNPLSCAVDDQLNTGRQAKLKQHLSDLGLQFFDGIGLHPSGSWPGEPSFLVLGVTLDTAKKLGVRYKQNAVIWSGSDALPQLILLR